MGFKVEHFTLDSSSSTAKRVPLSGTPVSRVALDIISGTTQFDQTGFTDATSGLISPDFEVDGTFVSWGLPSYTLYHHLAIGDKIRIIYDKA